MGVRFFHSGFPWLVAVVLGGRLALGASDIAADHLRPPASPPAVVTDEARLSPDPSAPLLAAVPGEAQAATAAHPARAPRAPRALSRASEAGRREATASPAPRAAADASPAKSPGAPRLSTRENPFLRYDLLARGAQEPSAAEQAARIALPRDRAPSPEGAPAGYGDPLGSALPASVQRLAAMAGSGGLRVDLPAGSREDPAVTGLAAQCSLWPVAVKVTGRFR